MSGNAALGTDQDAYNKNSGNADTTLGNYQGTENEYLSNVNSALAAGNPYQSKDYLTQQNIATSGAMHSANDAAQQQEEQTVARTGTNSAALPAEIAAQARAGQRDLTNYNATRDTENEDKWLGQRQQLLSDQQAGANSEAGVYGTTQGAANSALGDYTSAANADQQAKNGMIDAGIGAAGTVAGGWLGCPARGSLYLMADGTIRKVELLKVGDEIADVNGKSEPILHILKNRQPVLRITTLDGFTPRNSYSHAFAAPKAGLVEARQSLLSDVLSDRGITKVISVEPDGEDDTFNVITGGNHTFQADGVWSIGATESEMLWS